MEGESLAIADWDNFIGDMFFQNQIRQLGEIKAVTASKDKEFEANVKLWLVQEGF